MARTVTPSLAVLPLGGHAHEEGRVWRADAETDVDALLSIVRRTNDPVGAPDVPWAAVVGRPDGSIAATVTTSFVGGLYWTRDNGPHGARLLVSDNPAPMIRARSRPTVLDDDYLRQYALLAPPGNGSPYLGIGRIEPGTTAVWRHDGALQIHEWCGPQAWPSADRLVGGVVDRYRRVFDSVVAAWARHDTPFVATLSGGLDSTFLVATAAVSDTPPIEAFCHSPHPDAGLKAIGNWEPDDLPYAELLAAHYPDRIRVRPIVNVDRVQPLDAAARHADRSWLPVFNPGNQGWLDLIAQHAADLGADRWFSAGNGNAAFSWSPSDALVQHLRHREWRLAAQCLRGERGPGEAHWRRMRPLLVGPLAPGRLRRKRPAGDSISELLGVDASDPPLPTYRQWLAIRTGLAAALGPAGWPATPVDPFTSRSVLDLAASIPAAQWWAGPWDRGLARSIGKDRVPDPIRLRRTRGGQAWDAWYVMKDERDRYLAELAALEHTPVLGGWIAVGPLLERVRAWPWGELAPAPLTEVAVVTRLLALGDFIRMTEARLARLEPAAASESR